MMDTARFLWRISWLRRCVYFGFLLGIWQGLCNTGMFSELLLPYPSVVLRSLYDGLTTGTLLRMTWYSIYLILYGLAISFVLAALLTAPIIASPLAKDIIQSIVAIVDPLPGIALLPLAILWIGIGEGAILFVIVHSVLWPVLLNTISGFENVPKMYREVGASIGLKPLPMILQVYVPASFPSILTGVKTGWARAWRALISAEMVFGATGITGGLGWDIYMKRSFMDIPGMFASILVIMIIGILIEDILFKNIEKNTLDKWGMRS
jgi:NitT/TauT family transport system permease protein